MEEQKNTRSAYFKWVIILTVMLVLALFLTYRRYYSPNEQVLDTSMPQSQAVDLARQFVTNTDWQIQLAPDPKKIETREGEAEYDPVTNEYIMPVMKEAPEVEARKEVRKTWIVEMTYDVINLESGSQCLYIIEIDQKTGRIANHSSRIF